MRDPGREKHKDIHRLRGVTDTQTEKHHRQTAAQRDGHLEMIYIPGQIALFHEHFPMPTLCWDHVAEALH